MWGLKPEEYKEMTKSLANTLVLPREWRDTHQVKGLVDYMKEASKATLRHVYEEGEKDCPHHSDFSFQKWGCYLCRAELKKEVGL